MNFIIDYVIPLAYILAIAFLLKRNLFLKKNGIVPHFAIGFFIAKCLAGFLYSFIALKFIPNRGDIWPFYEDGLQLYQTLLRSPGAFISQLKEMFTLDDVDVLHTDSDLMRTVFEGIKFVHFVFNLFSFGNLYTNTILLNGIAALAFLRCWVFLKNYTQSWWTGAWVFLFPSAFFYSSGIHKEGIVMFLVAWLLPVIYALIIRFSVKKVAVFVAYFLLLFFFKFFVATTFLAAMGLWLLLEKWPAKRKFILPAALVVSISGFFLSGFISAKANLPQYIVNRQQEFLALDASSRIAVKELEPSFSSFCKALPAALRLVFFKPLPGEGGKMLYLVYTAEIYLFWAAVIFWAIKNRRLAGLQNLTSLHWCLLFFALANLIVIGYTIPNIGAMVRYRSIFLPFVGLFLWRLIGMDKLVFSKQFNR